MAFEIPTTQELTDANVARFEDTINQTVPRTRKAFARVVAIIQSMAASGMYKYAAERARQALILSADLDGLKYIGAQYGVDYQYATSAELQVKLVGDAGTLVTSDNYWVGDSNGVRYEMDEDVTLEEVVLPGEGTSVEMRAVASDAGEIGNLEQGDTLTVGNFVSGLVSTAEVEALLEEGVDDEDKEDYRNRLLNVVRSRGGGSNSADYRRWAEETPNVIRAFPYAGRPYYDDTAAGEKVTNGTFDTDLTGWTDNSTIDGAITWDSGTMKLDNLSP
jgi:uncharacterized phage protein gp47/JayE